MAVYPCSFYPHRYPQRQRSLYISDVGSARPETRKHRVCPRHFDQLLVVLQERFTFVEDDSQMSTRCEICEQPRESGLFVKVYDETGGEPAQYAVDLCGKCRLDTLQLLGWHDGLKMGA